MKWLVALVVLAFLILSALALYEKQNCLEYRKTGSTICWGGPGFMTCEPERECVRWKP